MSYLFSFSKISSEMCYLILIWVIDDVINFKIYLPSISEAMADRGKRRRRWKYKKSEFLENKKSFLDEIKNVFHSL